MVTSAGMSGEDVQTVRECDTSQPVLDVIREVISLWCVRSMGLLADSFIGLFSTPMIAVD